MVRKKLALFVIVLFSFHGAKAQETTFVKKGLIRAFATLSPSYLFSEDESMFYLHGDLEYYIDNKISLAGEGYMSLGNASGGSSLFKYNHNLFFGAARHFASKRGDFYVGFEPGVAFTKLDPTTNELLSTNEEVSPVLSATIGYNYFFYKYFHFFVQSRFIVGSHNQNLHKDLTEFRFSAGLGFNID